MCGLFGFFDVSDKLTSKEKSDIMKNGLFVSAFRGTDSTGLYSYDGASSDLHKSLLASPQWVADYTTSNTPLRKAGSSQLTIGHVRNSSYGMPIIEQNAHPFQIEDVILAHNGTLSYGWENTLGNEFDVDSKALAKAISEKGLEWVTENVEGAMSLVWHNTNDNTINFFRNTERPMHFLSLKGKEDVFIYGSEASFLKFSADKAGLEYGELTELPPNSSLSINLLTCEYTTKIDYTEYKAPVTYSHKNSYQYNGSGRYDDYYDKYTMGGYLTNNRKKSTNDPNTKLHNLGIIDKNIGDSMLFFPTSIKKYTNSKKNLCTLEGTHAWIYDYDIIEPLPDDQKTIIYAIDYSLAKAVMDSGLMLSAKILSVLVIAGQQGTESIIQLGCERVKVHSYLSDSYADDFNKKYAEEDWFIKYFDQTSIELCPALCDYCFKPVDTNGGHYKLDNGEVVHTECRDMVTSFRRYEGKIKYISGDK